MLHKVTTGNKTLDRLAPKYLDAILKISDERNMGDGWWIYLREPFFNPVLECKIIHEQVLADCIEQLKHCVNHSMTKEQYFEKQKQNCSGS